MPAALSNLSNGDLMVLAERHLTIEPEEFERETVIAQLRAITGEMVEGFEDDPSIAPPIPVKSPAAEQPESSEGNFADPNNNPSDLSTRVSEQDTEAIQAMTDEAGSVPAPE